MIFVLNNLVDTYIRDVGQRTMCIRDTLFSKNFADTHVQVHGILKGRENRRDVFRTTAQLINHRLELMFIWQSIEHQ